MSSEDNPEARSAAGDAPSQPSEAGSTAETSSRLRDLALEWLDYASYYTEARVDEMRVAVQEGLREATQEFAMWLVVGLLVGGGIALMSVGLALGLGQWFGDRPWLGWMVAGALLIGLSTTGMLLYSKRRHARGLERTRQRYQQRREQQQSRRGHSIHDRARPADEDRTGISA